jgi:hypothetical protein
VVAHGLGLSGQAKPAQVSEDARHPLLPPGVRYRLLQVEFQFKPERPGGVTRLGGPSSRPQADSALSALAGAGAGQSGAAAPGTRRAGTKRPSAILTSRYG